MEYEDFELEVGAGQGSHYPVRVLRSPTGEARETMDFPFDQAALDNQLQRVEIQMLRARARTRRMPSPYDRAAESLGAALFEALFRGSVRVRWEMSLEQARNQGKGLRLKLRLDDPGLAAIPWEFMYDASRGEFLCLSRLSPIVRYLHVQDPRRRLEVTPPLRILGLVASPDDLAPLDVDRERSVLDQAIGPLADTGRVTIDWLEGDGWRDLHRAMLRGPWHVLHFVGHGGFDATSDEGVIALVDRDGHAKRVSATVLGRLLADHPPLRLVVLNACEGARSGAHDVFSSTSSILVRRGIPAVLAMQFEIDDRAAIDFAESFYSFVGEGLPVDQALTEARKAVSISATGPEWATPVLHMHATDGRLFDIQPAGAPRTSSPPPRLEPEGAAVAIEEESRPEPTADRPAEEEPRPQPTVDSPTGEGPRPLPTADIPEEEVQEESLPEPIEPAPGPDRPAADPADVAPGDDESRSEPAEATPTPDRPEAEPAEVAAGGGDDSRPESDEVVRDADEPRPETPEAAPTHEWPLSRPGVLGPGPSPVSSRPVRRVPPPVGAAKTSPAGAVIPDRLAARLIDTIISGTVVLLVWQAWGLTAVTFVIGLAGLFAYFVLLRERSTVGRRALSLRVVSQDGEPVTAWQVAARNGWLPLPLLLFPASGSPTAIANLVLLNLAVFAVLAFSTWRHPDRVGLHDRLAGTMVVRVSRS